MNKEETQKIVEEAVKETSIAKEDLLGNTLYKALSSFYMTYTTLINFAARAKDRIPIDKDLAFDTDAEYDAFGLGVAVAIQLLGNPMETQMEDVMKQAEANVRAENETEKTESA